MQQCYNCGQYNEDYDDYCVYCGEAMYIQVDHDDKKNTKMDHLYADSIAKELIDDNTLFKDQIDEVTMELLGENQKEDEIFIIDRKEYDYNNQEKNYENRDNELILIEEEIKGKIRRNKKLESSMGLIIRNIDIILDDFGGPLLIMGDITTNDKLDNKNVKLSAIAYDENKKVISKQTTVVKVDHGNYENFNINLKLDQTNTDIIIILPEMIQYDNPEKTEDKHEITKEKVEIPQTHNNIFIEQMQDIERKIGLDLTNTSVLIKTSQEIEIVGEIRIDNPDKYHNIKIAATCYDEDNNIIGTQSTKINTKLFLGFDTLSLKIQDINVEKIQRIRLYPTLQ